MGNWLRSSYSGEGDGNNCVEISASTTYVAVRDSKAPSRATLAFPRAAFTRFLTTVKEPKGSPPPR
ncbi:DUF397 domain-containing protein [Streptomyces coelicoflavus]|uniref:DUF397 domain-containing protein n=1 Tax=Streptomyces coelicoflavus TaxID=285562 RepID=UPI00369D016C